MESLDIALKGIKAAFIYNMLREGVPKSNMVKLRPVLLFWLCKQTVGSMRLTTDLISWFTYKYFHTMLLRSENK